MEINKKTRNQLRLQGISFIVLVVVIAGLIFQVSRTYNAEFDWTSSGRHTISEASSKILEKLESEVKITSYATSGELSNVRHEIDGIIKRYQKVSDKIILEFVDPRLHPQKTTELGITVDGEMIVEYQGRSEHLKDLSEKSITNLIYRLLRNTDRQVLFVTGHGERNPLGQANHDVGVFVDNLSNKGFKVAPLDLAKTLSVPTNTSVLVIASPQVDYLPGEEKIIRDYIDGGGNLLWLVEPNKIHFLKGLAEYLQVKPSPGLVIDLDIGLLGNDPTLVLGDYVPHAITEKFKSTQTIFPQVTGIEANQKEGWSVAPFVQSMPRSWIETGKIEGSIKRDDNEKEGPITFAFAMTRVLAAAPDMKGKNGKKDNKEETAKEHEQRVIVLGDGDFLSNSFLGMQGNLAMGESIVNWLSHDDEFIDIPPTGTDGSNIVVTPANFITLGVIFLILLPLLFIASGFFIWFRRRKK